MPQTTPPTPRKRNVWHWLRRVIVFGAVAVIAGVAVASASDAWVRHEASGHVFTEETVPSAPVALVLGAEVRPDGQPNGFLAARLDIARRLLAAGKVRAILVSGDHMDWGYDEPGAMRQWLVDRGVPDHKVVLDHAGFDTYDSCARASRIFGVHRAIVVTQTYHIERAVSLCRELGVAADGVGDDTVKQFRSPWFRASVREHGASVKAVFDLASGRDPIFLGPHETGVDEAVRAR